MLGTVAYLKGRAGNSSYSLRTALAASPFPLWSAWVSFESFLFYVVAGKTCRTIMRGSLQTSDFFPSFLATAFLPVHLFPRDAAFSLLETDDLHQLIVSRRSLRAAPASRAHYITYIFRDNKQTADQQTLR